MFGRKIFQLKLYLMERKSKQKLKLYVGQFLAFALFLADLV